MSSLYNSWEKEAFCKPKKAKQRHECLKVRQKSNKLALSACADCTTLSAILSINWAWSDSHFVLIPFTVWYLVRVCCLWIWSRISWNSGMEWSGLKLPRRTMELLQIILTAGFMAWITSGWMAQPAPCRGNDGRKSSMMRTTWGNVEVILCKISNQ